MTEARSFRRPAFLNALALTPLAFVFLAGCVSAPMDALSLNGGSQVAQSSENGLVDATVTLEAASLARGQNRFLVALRPANADAGDADANTDADAGVPAPLLTGVVATMPAHGHSVTATSITPDGATFAADLDLFMSGLWQVDFAVAVGAQTDHVVLSLDVP